MHMPFSLCAASLGLRLPLCKPVRIAACVGFAGLIGAAPAYAQLGGGRLGLPSLSIPSLPQLPVQQTLDTTRDALPLQPLRLAAVRALLRKHADVLEADPAGEPVRRGELVLLSPSPAAVAAALALGFVRLREQTLPELDLHQVVLGPPGNMPIARALTVLRDLQPQLEIDFNHIYTASGDAGTGTSVSASAAATGPIRVGLIDSGVDAQHAALQRTELHPWGCQDKVLPGAHGTAVASLLVGQDRANQQAVATLYTADIYCGQPAGGSAEDVASALAWMAREHVAVVNISLVGPANRLLERSVQAMVRRGHLLVAAVGNDGPAAPPLYPASYAGVVGVTGVTGLQRVLPEAAQGPQVMFAAQGVYASAAQTGGGYRSVRGTSFAAPRVASLLARQLPYPDVAAAQAAIARLAESAQDLGTPGRDPVYGWGLVGTDKQ